MLTLQQSLKESLARTYNLVGTTSDTGQLVTDAARVLSTITIFIKVLDFAGHDNELMAYTMLMLSAHHPKLAGYILESMDLELNKLTRPFVEAIVEMCEEQQICGY